MPPFCAPAPAYLQSEPPSRPSSPSPGDNEVHDRAQMVASLVTALTDAEAAAAGESNDENPEQQHLLATQAYTSLCFDFPIVATNALAALAYVFKSSSLGTGSPVFPVTERFTSGLRYLVSIECSKQSTLDGLVVSEDGDAEREGECISDSKFRCYHLAELCGCVFLLAPARRFAVAHTDGGASLREFLSSFDHSSRDLLEQHNTSEEATTSSTGPNFHLSNFVDTSEVEVEGYDATTYDEITAEIGDDDSDWEALETFTPPPQVSSSEELTIPRCREKEAWATLLDKAALLTGSVSTKVIQMETWNELQLTSHLIQALNGMRALERMYADIAVISNAKLYADLLSDHLISGWSTSSSEVTQVISALVAFVEPGGDIKQRILSLDPPKIKTWNLLVLSSLSRVCSKVGGYPSRKVSLNNAYSAPSDQLASNGSRNHISRPCPNFVRSLWQSVFSNVQFLQAQLTDAQGGSEPFSQLEMVLCVLCFMVKYAPGNVNLRATLLEGGIFRIAVHLFVKRGAEPEMESLRHFLLLSMASCTDLAEFASQVPSFKAALLATQFCMEGSCTRAHAAIWPLILRAACGQSSSSRNPSIYMFNSNDIEGIIVASFDGIVKAVEDDTMKTNPNSLLRKLLWLHVLLRLLEEATSASSGSTFNLWERSGPLDISIGQSQVALGSLLMQVTETAAISSPRPKAPEKKFEELEDSTQSLSDSVGNSTATYPANKSDRSVEHSIAHETELVVVQEKLKEMLPSMLLQLKLLSTLTRENREAKID